jgi:hypothetical protein
MAIVGYMEGTDPALLTKIAAAGVETLPLGNGWDNHGLNITYINASDGIDVVIGYFHKFSPMSGVSITPDDMLKSCVVNNIKVLVMAEKADHEKVKKLLGESGKKVDLIDPKEAGERLMALVK